MKNKVIKLILFNEISVMLFRLVALYIVLGISQIIFYFYNQDFIGVISISEVFTLFHGSFIFNTISIIYANGLFIVLSLLPIRARSKAVYKKILLWIYLVTNTFLLIVLNLMDVVYFHYAQKRITAEEFHFTHNDNTLPIFLDYLWANSWLIFIGFFCIAFLVFVYKKIPYYPSTIKKSYFYYPVHVFLFCVFILVSLGGARGGFNPKLRPYNLCNAAWYTQTPQQAHLILSNPFCLLRTIELESLQNPNYFDE